LSGPLGVSLPDCASAVRHKRDDVRRGFRVEVFMANDLKPGAQTIA
jgi:hypothetical protein